MSTYRYGTDNVGHQNFKAFVDEYLKDYDGRKLRIDLRNKLVHNYSLGETYVLTMRNHAAHLKKGINGSILLNLENFVNDLEKALEKFLQQLVTEADIRKSALKILSKNNIVGMSDVEYINTDHPELESRAG